MTDTTAQLIPDADQHDLLMATLERVNKACNAARVRALDDSVKSGPALRSIVLEELERFRLPATFNVPSTVRVTQSLTRQKFGNYQSITFSAAALKWSGTDRVSIPYLCWSKNYPRLCRSSAWFTEASSRGQVGILSSA